MSIWVDTTNDNAYICVDSTASAAVWKQINGGDSGGTLNTNLSVSGSHDIDRDDGETHDLTLTGNATFTLSGALTGQATDIRVLLRQDGTGSRTVTWPTITWVGGSAPTLQTAANAVDTIGLLTVDDGSTWFGYHASAGGSTTLEALTDTTITAAADGDYLRHNGTAWVDSPLQADDIKSKGRWEPVQFDDGSSPWPFVYFDDEIVVAWVAT